MYNNKLKSLKVAKLKDEGGCEGGDESDEGCDEDADEGSMIDTERLGVFGDRLMNDRTDIGNCRVSFASENVSVSLTLSLDKVKSKSYND